MSRRGNCWDNAVVESFFGSSKKQRISYFPAVPERAVRLVLEQQGEHDSRWAAIISVSSKIGLCAGDAVRTGPAGGLAVPASKGSTGAWVRRGCFRSWLSHTVSQGCAWPCRCSQPGKLWRHAMKRTVVNLRTMLVLAGSLFACLSLGGLALAQLPPAVMADRYLVQADRELRSGDAAAAVETLNLIVALQAEHGLEVPEVFWFRRAEAAYAARDMELTLESVVRYIELSGQDGEHYLAALELYDAAELAKVEADELAAALAAAEAERLAADAEALEAAVAVVAPEMVVIPAGSFRMGCVSGQECFDDEQPVHDVTIPQAFAVSKYEVTFAQWDACVLDGGCGRIQPGRSGLGPGDATGDRCVVGGRAGLCELGVVADRGGVSLAERG